MINDGGPFFPHDGQANYTGGATLRDWNAGQALMGLVRGYDNLDRIVSHADKLSEVAYCLADAMLVERAKEGS